MKEYFQPLPLNRIQNNLYIRYRLLENPDRKRIKEVPMEFHCTELIRIFLQDQPIVQICHPEGEKLWRVRAVTECKYYRWFSNQLRSTRCDLEWEWVDVDSDWMVSKTLAVRWFRNNLRFILDTYTPDSIKQYLGLMK